MRVEGAEESTPGRIRTCDLSFRKAVLYPTELQGHAPIVGTLASVGTHFGTEAELWRLIHNLTGRGRVQQAGEDQMTERRAFALVEALVVICLAAVLLAVCLPTIQEQRRQASIKADLSNMRLIGQASAMYSGANAGRLFTFSWEAGQVPVTPNAELALACAVLNPNSPGAESRAGAIQHLDLVTHGIKDERLTPNLSTVAAGFAPYPLYNHLVLAHFVGETLPSDLFISRGDNHRTYWLNHIDEYLDDPRSSPARPPSAQTSFNQLWRWAFSSSYQVGVSHYSNDIGSTGNSPLPMTAQRATNHLSWVLPNRAGVLGHRNAAEVAFPSMKVMMFDEYDRYNATGRQFFGLDTSSSTMNFYDGHAARLATADSNYGFIPNDPTRGADTPDQPTFVYFYSPISWWDPPGAFREAVPVRYDQTRGGLQGIDYPAK